MARIRTIKPEFPQSESIGRLSRDARLLFVQLWTLADDAGRTRAASRLLASLLYPYDDDAPSLLDEWLTELEREGCILRYAVEGTAYLQIRNWEKHQKIDRPTPSRLPGFDESSRGLASKSRSIDAGPRTVDLGINTPPPPPGGARASARNEKSGTRKTSQRLSKAELSDTAIVLTWLRSRGRKMNLDPEDFLTQQRAVAIAELALRAEGPGYFEACMRNHRFEQIADDDLHRAKRRLAEHTAGAAHPAVLSLAAALAGPS